jgi:hypothetical protein
VLSAIDRGPVASSTALKHRTLKHYDLKYKKLSIFFSLLLIL